MAGCRGTVCGAPYAVAIESPRPARPERRLSALRPQHVPPGGVRHGGVSVEVWLPWSAAAFVSRAGRQPTGALAMTGPLAEKGIHRTDRVG